MDKIVFCYSNFYSFYLKKTTNLLLDEFHNHRGFFSEMLSGSLFVLVGTVGSIAFGIFSLCALCIAQTLKILNYKTLSNKYKVIFSKSSGAFIGFIPLIGLSMINVLTATFFRDKIARYI